MTDEERAMLALKPPWELTVADFDLIWLCSRGIHLHHDQVVMAVYEAIIRSQLFIGAKPPVAAVAQVARIQEMRSIVMQTTGHLLFFLSFN